MKGPYIEVGSGRVFTVSTGPAERVHEVSWEDSSIAPGGTTIFTEGNIGDLVDMGIWRLACTGCGRPVETDAFDSAGWHFGACCIGHLS